MVDYMRLQEELSFLADIAEENTLRTSSIGGTTAACSIYLDRFGIYDCMR